MAQSSEKTSIKSDFLLWIYHAVFFIGYYLYIWLRIDPSLYFQAQEPVFLLTRPFFIQFLSYPGGLVDYIGAFLSQFYYYPWAGALIITGIALLVCLATRWIILAAGQKDGFLHLIPAVFLIVMYSHYDQPMSYSVGLLVALLFSLLYIRIRPKNSLLSLFIYLVMAVILHAVAAGPFLLFMAVGMAFELYRRNRTVIQKTVFAIVAVLFLGIWPILSANNLFTVSLPDAYHQGLSTHLAYRLPLSNYLLYLILFLLILIVQPRNRQKSRPIKNQEDLHYLVLLVIVLGTGLAAIFTFDRVNHHILKTDYYARRHMWNKVLEQADKNTNMNQSVLFYINRALYHLGRLPDEMFNYTQQKGSDAIALPKDARLITPLLRSDIFLELGQLNEADHWALEALTVKGTTPWNLKRLTTLNITRGEPETARKYIHLLENTLLFKNWGNDYKDVLARSLCGISDPQLEHSRSLLGGDYVRAITGDTETDMISLLKQKSQNKMAFEYLMAHYLLTRQISKFVAGLSMMDSLDYQKMPKHYQEALMVFFSQKGTQDIPVGAHLKNFSGETIKSFQKFQQIMKQYKGNKKDAAMLMTPELKKTYWYYLLYLGTVNKKHERLS